MQPERGCKLAFQDWTTHQRGVAHGRRGARRPLARTAKAIQQHVRTRLSAYHYPRLVEFVPSLPKTLTGKIRRIELREAEARRVREAQPATS